MGSLSINHPPRRRRALLQGVFLTLLAFLFLPSALRIHPQNVPATAIPLVLPSVIAFAPPGNLSLADPANHAIRKVAASGDITPTAGPGPQGFSGDNGLATPAQLDSPQGPALDTANNLYIADTHNHRIRRI